MSNKLSVAVIGGGPSAMALASFIDKKQYNVTLYEKNTALGRKFLVAGKGGFNLTHSEPFTPFIQRYSPSDFLQPALLKFNNLDLQNWLDTIGVPTFIGSSKRVYPKKGIKPIQVLKAIENELVRNGVQFKLNHEWTGFENDRIQFNNSILISPDIVIFALGGGSWQVTGTNSKWLTYFEQINVKTKSFLPSNCAYEVNWEDDLIKRFEGSPLKNIAIACGNAYQKGEVVITKFGLEGNAIYALSPEIRAQILNHKKAAIYLDFKPTLSLEQVHQKLIQSKEKQVSGKLKMSLKLTKQQIGLLKTNLNKETFVDLSQLAHHLKKLKLEVMGWPPVDEAISTVGGVDLNEVDENFQLKKRPNHYCIGEMLDWDAPTGGYLLQACFSMGYHLADHLNIK
ncbi:MAG: NAD(P)/FAD-dependent oxidoreductase [Putridiphycobacter sp.]